MKNNFLDIVVCDTPSVEYGDVVFSMSSAVNL